MDKQRNQPIPEEKVNQKVKFEPPILPEQQVTFTDKKRKREEIDNSTIGGF